MDITSQAVADTSVIHVKSAAGELLYADAERTKPVQIIVYGPGSKEYGVVEARQSARALKRMNENEGKLTMPAHEEMLTQAAEDLAAITVEFVNFSYPPAKDAKGAKLFAAVYSDQKLGFIAKQVTKHLADWGNFKPGSATA